jgi:AcrR family transcriptional regulator
MKAANLTHGSFYNHFDSKQSLIAACIAHVVNSPPHVPTAKAFCRRTAF